MSKQEIQCNIIDSDSTPFLGTLLALMIALSGLYVMLLLIGVFLSVMWPEKFANENVVPPVYVWDVTTESLTNRVQVLSEVLQNNGYQVYLDRQPYESADEFDSSNTTVIFNTDENSINYITNDALFNTLQPLGYLFCDTDGNPVELDKSISRLMVLGYNFSIYPAQKMVVVSRNSKYHGQIKSYQTITEASVDIKDQVYNGKAVYKYLYQ